MSERRSARREIAIGTRWSIITWGLSVVSGPVLVIALIRRMTRGEYGSLATASSAVGIAAALVTIGLQISIARYGGVARAESGRAGLVQIMRDSYLVVVLTSLAAVLAGGLLTVLVFSDGNLHSARTASFAFLPALLVAPAAGAAGGFLRAAFRPRWVSLAGVIGPFAGAALIVAELVEAHPPAWEVAAARSGGTVLSALVLVWGVAHWRATGSPDSDPEGAAGTSAARSQRGELVRYGMATQLSVLFATVVSELGVVILGAVRGSHAPGLFAPAAGIAATILGVPTVIAGYLLPGMAPAAARGDDAEVGRLFHLASKWQLAFTAPAVAVMIVCPADVLRILFGAGLVQAAGPLRILGLGCAAQFLFGFNGLTFTAYALPALMAKLEVLNLFVAVVLAAALIPAFGITGAAAALSASMLFANLVYSVILTVRYRIRPADRPMLITIVLACAAVPVSWAAVNRIGSPVLACAVVAAITAAASMGSAMLTADRGERRSMLRLMSGRTGDGAPA